MLGNFSITANVTTVSRRSLSSKDAATLAFLCITMATAIGGNLRLVLHIRRVRQRTSRIMRIDCFLVNLAIGDICVGAVVCSGELLFVAFGQWELGPAMCKLTVYTQSVCLASTAFLLMTMTIDRYEVIVRPLDILRHRSSRIARRIASCWLGALIFALPQLFIFKETLVDGPLQATSNRSDRRLVCASTGYTAAWQRKLYMLYVLLVVVAMPTVVMIRCFASIVLVIWRRTRPPRDNCQPKSGERLNLPVAGSRSIRDLRSASPANFDAATTVGIDDLAAADAQRSLGGGGRLLSRAKIKAVFMSLTVVSAFLAWVPYFMTLLTIVYSDGVLLKNSILVDIAKHLVLLHSVLNPIIYFMFATRLTLAASLSSACLRCCRWCCRCCCGRLDDEEAIYYYYSTGCGQLRGGRRAAKPMLEAGGSQSACAVAV